MNEYLIEQNGGIGVGLVPRARNAFQAACKWIFNSGRTGYSVRANGSGVKVTDASGNFYTVTMVEG